MSDLTHTHVSLDDLKMKSIFHLDGVGVYIAMLV